MAQEFHFDDFTLDQARYRLQRGERLLRLERLPMELLILLVQRGGELVSREEIAERLWGRDVFVDVDHSINTAVSKVRLVLRDDPEKPRFVETVVGKGYRFAAPVVCRNGGSSVPVEEFSPVQDSIEPAVPSAESTSAEARHVSKRVWIAIGTAAVLAFIALTVLWYRGWSASPVTQQAIKSIAVLPLKNLSGDPAQEYLADGMTEELIKRLSAIHDLRVISRTSAMRFKDSPLSLPEIAKALHVDAIVEGSVIRQGNRIRVHAQLIHGASDKHVWASTYDRQIQDILSLESEVTEAIADQIRIRLTPEQQARLHSTGAVNLEAYEAYFKGRVFLQMNPTPQAHKYAEGYFQEAIRKDPTFAAAYAGLADCYLDSGAYRLMRPQEAYRLGSEAIQNATKLDPRLSEVHASLGYLHWQYDWDWPAAEKEFRYALDLNPGNVDAREGLIWYLAWSGRRAEALAELDKIRAPDTTYPLAYLDEAGIEYHRRDYKALMEASRKALDSDPNNWSAHYFIAVSHDGLGQPGEAIPEYKKAVELSQWDTDALARLAHAYALVGERTETRNILRQLRERPRASYVSPYMVATIHTALGNKDTAFAFLEHAYQEKSPDIAYFLKADPRLDPLRNDPRFADLLRRVGLN